LLLAVAVGLGLAGQAVGTNSPAALQEGNKKLQQGGPAETREYYSVDRCRTCHTNGNDAIDDLICRCTESPIWETSDKHAVAFKVLAEDRAKRMGRILGGEKDTKDRPECLSCHAVWVEEKPGITLNARREEGVSCAACHGPDIVA